MPGLREPTLNINGMSQADAVWREQEKLNRNSLNELSNSNLMATLAACYFYEVYPDLQNWLGLVRLAALCYRNPTHLDQIEGLTAPELAITIWLIAGLSGDNQSPTPNNLLPLEADALQQALRLAYLASDTTVELTTHQRSELAKAKIGLAYGGATKIKEYVFESSRLPEIRGASSLLDYINLNLIPALFRQLEPHKKLHNQTYVRVKSYQNSSRLQLVPEGLIYANGGEFLAFAPASQAATLATLVEEMYAVETLTAQAVAVSQSFSLLQVREGLEPNATEGGKGFSQLVNYLSYLRYRRREFNPLPGEGPESIRCLAHFDTFPLGRRCDSCDRRIALIEQQDQQRRLCEPCARKAVVGQQQRGAEFGKWFTNYFDWQPPQDLENWQDKFNSFLKGGETEDESKITARKMKYLGDISETDPTKIRMAADVDSIDSSFIGVIYGDGNNMGKLLQEIKDAAEYHNFAQRVFDALLEAVKESLAAGLHPQEVRETDNNELRQHKTTEKAYYHPFEILSVGGDDIYMFVPGKAALPIAVNIAEQVELKLSEVAGLNHSTPYKFEAVQRYLPDEAELKAQGNIWDHYKNAKELATSQSKVSLSSGVLIVPNTTPIFFLNGLVEQLLKSAKNRAKNLRGGVNRAGKKLEYQGGTIDFMALKSVAMVTDSIASWREQSLQRNLKYKEKGKEEEQEKELHLTARPYTLWEMRGLLEALRLIREGESLRGQLYRLREQLAQGELAGRVNYLYLVTQSGDKGAKLERLVKQWSGADNLAASPWFEDKLKAEKEPEKQRLYSILADLAELYDFAQDEVEGS